MYEKQAVGIVALAALMAVVAAAEESTTEWLETHAVPKTTETRTFNSSGDVQSMTVIREYSVQIRQRYVETLKRDETGSLVVASRTRATDTVDAHGGKKATREATIGSGGLKVVKETETFKSANATEIITRKRNSIGQLAVSQRITKTLQEDGTTVTVVEGIGEGGSLAVKKITTQE